MGIAVTVNCPECAELLYQAEDEHEEAYVASDEIWEAVTKHYRGNEAECPFCETVVVLEAEE